MFDSPPEMFRQVVSASTDAHHKGEKRAFWQDLCRQRMIIGLQCEPLGDANFRAHADGVVTNHASVFRFDFSPHSVSWERDQPTGFDPNGLHVDFIVSGAASFEQDGREVLLREGDGACFLSDRPFAMRFEQPSSIVAMRFSPDLFHCPSRLEEFTAKSLTGPTGVGAMIYRFVEDFSRQAGAMDPLTVNRLSQVCVDLLDACFETVAGRDAALLPSHKNATLFRAKRYVQMHVADPELSVDSVAAGLKLSVRSLNRLFENEGTSLARYIWSQRLERAAIDLSNPRLRKLPISSIAFQSGFKNVSHFSFAFRERFDLSPTDYRQRAGEIDAASAIAESFSDVDY